MEARAAGACSTSGSDGARNMPLGGSFRSPTFRESLSHRIKTPRQCTTRLQQRRRSCTRGSLSQRNTADQGEPNQVYRSFDKHTTAAVVLADQSRLKWAEGSCMHAAPPPTKRVPRTAIRLAVPSKGRMAEDTLQLLKVRPLFSPFAFCLHKILFMAKRALLKRSCNGVCAGLPAQRVQAQPAAVHSQHLAGACQWLRRTLDRSTCQLHGTGCGSQFHVLTVPAWLC